MNTLEFIGTKKVTIAKVIDQLIEVSFAMFVNKSEAWLRQGV